jgi:hypothetical protein
LRSSGSPRSATRAAASRACATRFHGIKPPTGEAPAAAESPRDQG